MWEIKVKKAENGFVLEYQEEIEDGIIMTRHIAIEEDYSEELKERYKTNLEQNIAFGKLFEQLANYFGLIYDKYGKENLNISFDKKGHKLD